MSSTTIHNNLLRIWGVDVAAMFALAKVNTPKLLPASIKDMNQVIMDIIGDNIMSEFVNPFDQMNATGPRMYIATNSNGINGAAVMIYVGLIRDFAREIGTDLYLIPSSIHELILIKADNYMKPCDIRNMISEVNASEVQPDEVLGENLYFYSRETDYISIVK